MSLATYTPVHKNNTQMRLCIILYFSLLPNKRKRQENHSKDNVMNRFTIRAYSATKYPPTVNPYLIPAKLKIIYICIQTSNYRNRYISMRSDSDNIKPFKEALTNTIMLLVICEFSRVYIYI